MTTSQTDLNNEIFKAIKENFWSVYDTSTIKLSMICRQLAFAEGGICWFYILPSSHLHTSANVPSIFYYLIWFFIIDAIQYLANAAIYAFSALYFECKNNHNFLNNIRDLDRRRWMMIIPLILFAGKLFFISKSSYMIIQLLH
jgi:hypothetical protein